MKRLLVAALIGIGFLGIGTRAAAAGTATEVSVDGRHACAVTSGGGAVCRGG